VHPILREAGLVLCRDNQRIDMKMIRSFRGTYGLMRGTGYSRWLAFKRAVQNALFSR
jgi:hypothetical protein